MQSDHFALAITLDFDTIESLRTSMIHKERMIKDVWKLRGLKLQKAQNDPIATIMELRSNNMTNKISTMNKKHKNPFEHTQTKINDKILLFDQDLVQLRSKDTHSMI